MEVKKKSFIWAMICAVSVVLFIVISNRIAPFLIDNDNIYLKTVVSGEMTGTPEMRGYHLGIISGFIMSSLYKLTGNYVPWFGIILCLYAGIVIWYVLYNLATACKKWYMSLCCLAVGLLVSSSIFFRYFVQTQFTIIGGFLGAGAALALALVQIDKTVKENRANLIMLFVFALLSFSVRSSAFYRISPFLGMILLDKFIDYLGNKKESHFAVLVFAAGVIVLSMVINILAGKIAYSSEDWKSYDKYNELRADMVDYEGFPDYEIYRDVYEKYGIKESSYRALTEHYNLILDKNINEESLAALDEITRENRSRNNADLLGRLKEVFSSIIERNIKDYTDRPINVFVFWMYAAVIVLAVLSKKFKAVRDVGFLIVARMFDWIYLVYNGRYPFRVTQIIYVAELFLLVAIAIKYRLWERAFKKPFTRLKISPVFIASVLVICFIAVRFGLPVMRNVKNEAIGFDKMSVCFSELEDYLEDHPDNFYFFDMTNLHYKERTLGFGESAYENYVYMGSWITNSPWYNDKLKAHGIEDPAVSLVERDDLYIIYQVDNTGSRDFLDEYFEEHFPGTKINKADEFVSSNGFVYEILSVEKE